MYKVNGKWFDTFNDVIDYAYNNHKIIFENDDTTMTEQQKVDACNELAVIEDYDEAELTANSDSIGIHRGRDKT